VRTVVAGVSPAIAAGTAAATVFRFRLRHGLGGSCAPRAMSGMAPRRRINFSIEVAAVGSLT